MAIRHTSIPVHARNNPAKTRWAAAAGTTAAGAAIGSVVPGLGTAIGAGVGAVVGLATGGAAVGIEAAIQTKKEKVAKARGKTEYYRQTYSKCKQKVLQKGKKPYPEDPRTSIFAKNCHTSYKSWKKWERTLGEAARSLEASLEAKGQLGEEAKKSLKGAQRQAQVGAMTAEQKERFKRKQRAKKITRLEKKGYESEFVPDEIPTDEVVEEEGMDSTTMTLLAVGGLAAVGGIYWFFIRKPEA